MLRDATIESVLHQDVKLHQLLVRSGKRELHPYVRPGLCSVLLSLFCFILSGISYKLFKKYSILSCDKYKSTWPCTFFFENGYYLSIALVLIGIGLFSLGTICSFISVFYLIRKTMENENKKRHDLKHFCQTKLHKKRESSVSCSDKSDHCTTECVSDSSEEATLKRKSQRRPRKNLVTLESLSWKSFSKSILVESEDSQIQNELLIAEISKALKADPKDKMQKPKNQHEDNHYFQIPFKQRLGIEELIKKIALDGISLCNCHKCSFCHCHIQRNPFQKDGHEDQKFPDFDSLYVA